MTVESAELALKRPLIFGDWDQIKAVDFLEAVERCREAAEICRGLGHKTTGRCYECSGTGSCEHCGHDCDDCDGTGRVNRRPQCTCLDLFSTDVQLAAEDDED